MTDYADALAEWLEAVSVERPHILGLSWGSSLALEFYRRYPEVPASLILVGAYAGWAGSLPPEEVAARLESVLAAADLPREQLLALWPGILSSAAPRETMEEIAEIWADNAGGIHPGGFRAMAHSMAEADLRGVLPGIRVPTLMIYGELDQRASIKVANDLQARIPSAKLVVIPGVGHLANVEAPDEFNSHVRQFIRSIS